MCFAIKEFKYVKTFANYFIRNKLDEEKLRYQIMIIIQSFGSQ